MLTNQGRLRTVASTAVLATTLAAVGATGAPSQAAVDDDKVPAEYVQILRDDPTAALDSSGQLFYREPLPAGALAAARTPGMAPAAAPQFPLDQTFDLHSKAGSQRTIYLDFDGMTVSGTRWNDEGLPNGTHPAWTLDGNASTFNNAERTMVQEIWQWVAEDFAPFDVDVTTADPGVAGITRSSAGDQVYGARALITPSNAAVQNLCDGQCVGIAYVDVFDQVGGDSQPVWVFPQFYDEAKGIGETISHEVGHNLALKHDGNDEEAYYSGHNPWAPIMGNSDLQPISQWSRGDYPNADNQQDDVAVIASHGIAMRTDEAGNSVGAAEAAVPAGTAYITTRTDKDFYALGQCSGAVQIDAVGAVNSPNLDIELSLYRVGTPAAVATANPQSARVSAVVASGMSASIDTSVTAGSYVVSVDGVGRGSAYDDYGSLGAYTLDVSGCDGDPGEPGEGAPGAPTDLTVESGPLGTTAIVTWAAPDDEGGSAITGYLVTIDGETYTADADTTGGTIPDLTRGQTYVVGVAAVNDAGPGPEATATFTTYDVPGAPSVTSARSGSPGGQVTASVRWQPPTVDGGTEVTAYRIKATRWSAFGRKLSSGTTSALPASQLSSSLRLGRAGIWSFQVQARNDLGWGPFSSPSARVRGR